MAMSLEPSLRNFDETKVRGPVVGMRVNIAEQKSEVPVHQHRQGQLVLALKGGVTCEVPNAIWMVPRAVPCGFQDKCPTVFAPPQTHGFVTSSCNQVQRNCQTNAARSPSLPWCASWCCTWLTRLPSTFQTAEWDARPSCFWRNSHKCRSSSYTCQHRTNLGCARLRRCSRTIQRIEGHLPIGPSWSP